MTSMPVQRTDGRKAILATKVERTPRFSQHACHKKDALTHETRGRPSLRICVYRPKCIGMITWVNSASPMGRMTPGLEDVVVSNAI
jgi:hypothetical protein